MTGPTLPRVVLSGVDTLHVFTRAPLFLPEVERLVALKEMARASERNERPRIDLAGQPFAVQPHGTRTASLFLDGEHMALKASPGAPRNLPTAALELRSLFLWQRGAAAAADAAADVLAVITRPTVHDFPGPELHVSRLDLTVDFQAWVPRPEDLGRFVTRAEQRTLHHDRDAFTGFMFGRGDVAARIYDKTIEIRKSGKMWFREMWATAQGFDPSAPVWRLEFQLRRNALRTFAHGAGASALDTWAQVARAIPDLWQYLCRRWLSLRAPRTGRTRQRLVPEWQALTDEGFRGGPWRGATGPLYRLARETRARLTDTQLAAYLARGVAEYRFFTGYDGPLDSAIERVVGRARERRAFTGETLGERADAYLDRWRTDERASLPAVADPGVAPNDSEPASGPGAQEREPDEEVAA